MEGGIFRDIACFFCFHMDFLLMSFQDNLRGCFQNILSFFLKNGLLQAVGLSRIARGEVVSFCVPAVF